MAVARRVAVAPKAPMNCYAAMAVASQRRLLHASRKMLRPDEGEEVVVEVPSFTDSIKEGDLSTWEVKVGDPVIQDQVVASVETDKTVVEVFTPHHGVITELLANEEDTVQTGNPLFKMKWSAAAPEGAAAAAPAKDAPAAASTASANTSAPAAAPAAAPTPTPTTAPTPTAAPTAATNTAGSRTERREKMSRMRQTVAKRLKESQETAAMLTTFNEIDMSNAIEFRKQYKDRFVEKHGVKMGFMSFFTKAASKMLQEIPAVNAVVDGNELVYRNFIDISVAVASPAGLVVPVLRNVENMDFADVERGIQTFGKQAREGSLAIEDMSGGTFSISNGGVFGSLMGTPIINQPQSAILGMHATFDRPVAINGKVEIRPMMYVALTYDHRIIDGREAVTFLKGIKENVEDPRRLLIGV